jgi:hypothetical protein
MTVTTIAQRTVQITGPAHWTVEMVHLKIGIVAMLVAARLARFVRQHAPADAGARIGAVRAQHG